MSEIIHLDEIVTEAAMKCDLIVDQDFDSSFVLSHRSFFEDMVLLSRNVIIDMSSTDFIDSSGIGALTFLWKRLEPKGHKIHLVGLRGNPAKLLDNLHLTPLFVQGQHEDA